MIDNSPGDVALTPENAMPWPSGPITVDVDGSVTGCDRCHRPFALMQSRAAHVFAGRLTFRHTFPCTDN